MRIARSLSFNFPSCEILVSLDQLIRDPLRQKAKEGDVQAAHELLQRLRKKREGNTARELAKATKCIWLPVVSIEKSGHNVLPAVLAEYLSAATGHEVTNSILQINVAEHTGADGWHRLAHPALFDGKVQMGARYWLVDDFVGMGGTLANLRGFVEAAGGHVSGCTALTGRADSSTLRLDASLLGTLRSKHGTLDDWWRWRFGYGTDCLTFSEARFLGRAETVDRIRDRMASAGLRARIAGES